MDITVTLERGPLHFKISGESREDIQEEVLGLAKFIQENEETLAKFGVQGPQGASEEQVEVKTEATSPRGFSQPQQQDASEFASISQQTRVEQTNLAQMFEIPDNEDEPPFLNMSLFEEGTDVLGNYRNQKQSQGSTLLLYLWQECRGVDAVDFEDLDRGLSYSDIDIERRDAMQQAFGEDARKWFDSDGDSIRLTTPGEHQARQLIQELAEKL